MKYKILFSRPLIWVLMIILAVSGIFYVLQNFEKANSLINIDIQMDRESALGKATQLAEEFGIGPEEYKQAAAFQSDTHFRFLWNWKPGG